MLAVFLVARLSANFMVFWLFGGLSFVVDVLIEDGDIDSWPVKL